MSGEPRAAIVAASAPVCFGVNEVLPPDAWLPEPTAVVEAIAGLGYRGTELGPPGYLGTGTEVRERLGAHGLELVGSFLPMHFSRQSQFDDERSWLVDSLAILREGSSLDRPYAVLSDGFDEPARMAYAGRIAEHPEAWLPPDRFATLMANLRRRGCVFR